MLQVIRLAPRLLGESAGLIKEYLESRMTSEGSFPDRSGNADLYYTVFGLDALLGLDAKPDPYRLNHWLKGFGAGEQLDFVHLCCLCRAWAIAGWMDPECAAQEYLRLSLADRLAKFRSSDDGFHGKPGADHGSAYGGFLGLSATQDLGVKLENPLGLVQSYKFLEKGEGAWANERHIPEGGTNATAAAVTVLRHLEMPVAAKAGDWLRARFHVQGGFCASPQTPMPDLLSTATALHALSGLQHDFRDLKESCLDFVDTLWTNEGAFHGHWADDALDCEYTYYGLLALGHLSV